MSASFPYRTRRRWDGHSGINSDHTWRVSCDAVGKERNDENQYLIANEWIAACLAQFLKLPVPPFALMRSKSSTTRMFCSYVYELEPSPNDLQPELLYAKNPKLCAGIVLFDIFVLNCDRHSGNIKVDNPRKPKRVHIFDHDRALFYNVAGEGIARLQSRRRRFGINDGDESAVDGFHCLIQLLASVDHIQMWLGKIESIPDWFIDETCGEPAIGLKKQERTEVAFFLKERRSGLEKLIKEHWGRFPGISLSDRTMFP